MVAYYKTEVPFLRLILFFIVGITCSISLNLKPNFTFELSFYLLCAISSFCILFYQRFKLYLKRDFTGVLIYFTVAIAGLVITNNRKDIYKEQHFSKFEAAELIGVVDNSPKTKGDIARFTLKVKANVNHRKIKPTLGLLLVALRFDSTKNFNLKYGDQIILKAKYQETEPPYNFAEFNYRRYLQLQNIYHQTFINQKQIAIIDTNQGNPIIAFALKFREQQVAKINNYLKDKDARAVAATLILGYRESLDKDLLNTYSNTGTMHVLSVSGMHVGIVAVFLSYMLWFLNKSKKARFVKAIIIVMLVWFYALITGLAPSITRAAIMITFVIISRAKAKPVNIFNILGFSAFIILIYNPFALFNVGFQLSYMAVGGLIYLYPKVSSWCRPTNKSLKAIWAVMAVSIAAQIITAPFSLFYFHQFPVYFMLSNVFIVVPATLIMYIGFVFLMIAGFQPLAQPISTILEQVILFTNGGLKVIAQIPNANITQVWLDKYQVMLCYCLIIALAYSLKHVRFLRVSLLFATLFTLSISFKQLQNIKQKKVTFFSLRKNTAIALIQGKSAVLITDLPDNDFTYQFSIKPYLDSCQINNLKFVNPHQIPGEKTYSFAGKKLKIIDESGFNKIVTRQDWLLMSTNRIVNLKPIIATHQTKNLLIDGRNRDFVIENLKTQAAELKLPVKILKRAFAVEYKFD